MNGLTSGEPAFASSDRIAGRIDAGCCDAGADLLCVGDDDTARSLAATGFAALWRGTVAQPAQLVPASPHAAGEVAAALAARGRAELDSDGRLVGIHGLTSRATRHRIVEGSHAHWTWCAFDAIGIPAALGLNAAAHTDCPTCGDPLTIEFTDGAPTTERPVLWLPAPASENLLAEFCASADLYCSVEHLRQRIDPSRVPGQVHSLSEAVALGVRAWADIAHIDLTSPA